MSPFADIDEKKPQTNSKFKKTLYMETGEGQHVVRILEPKAKKFYVHYIGYSYVQCLGEDCPICENNKKLLYEFQKEANKQKTWKPRVERFYVNVLDKTKGKNCTECGLTHKNTALLSCTKCGGALDAEKPLNKVVVLAKGKTLFEDFDILSNTVRDVNDEVVPIVNYDWVLVIKGEGKDTTTVVTPRWFESKSFPETFEGQELFDLTSVVPLLTREELVELLNGANIKDIFALRRASKEATKVASQPAGDAVLMRDISAAVDEIFKS